jgi:23S rRNA (uracil1939-C5)-methyltransferase
VINAKKLPQSEALIHILKTNAGVKNADIAVNINMNKNNTIMGDKTVCVWGKPYITDKLCGMTFQIGANSFFQVNNTQTELLYQKAAEYARGENNSCAIDIYCGIGTVTLLLARQFKKVYGIEIVPDAISDARANAKLNGIDNVEFVQSDATEAINALSDKGIAPNCLLIDPPRKGCDGALLYAMLKMQPQRIVYISCNPATLARDINTLSPEYELTEISIFDCFPQTVHVECAALLRRR